DENLDMQRLLQRCIRALKEAMEPDGYNLGMNLGRVAGAGVPDRPTTSSRRTGPTKGMTIRSPDSSTASRSTWPHGP
ncbi:MAG: HIT family protein, partial [Actinomycetota bacterium]